MEAFFLYYSVFFATIIVIPIFVIFFARKPTSNKQHLPPGSNGWPILGETMNMAMSGPERYIVDRMNKHSSEVFKTSLLGEKMVVFCSAAANKFLFANEGKLVSFWWPRSITKPLICPSDEKDPEKKLALMNHAFVHEILRPEHLKQYIPVMDALARKHVTADWAPFHHVKAYDLSKKYTFALGCKLLVSVEDPDHVKKLSDRYVMVTSGMFSVPVDFPGTAYHRALKGGRMVCEEILKIIAARRKEAMENRDDERGYRDLLSRLMSATDENGKFLSDTDICNNLVGLLVASYDTTSAALSFTIKFLAELPHIYDKVYKEQMEIAKSKGPNELLNWEDIQKMKYTWCVACEALRLVPPGLGAFREALTDFTYAGFTIPKGWKIFWSVFATNKNSKYYSDPEKFDPSRFEGSGPPPFSFVPFGGGPRMCPGREYGRLELLVFIHNLVTKFKLEKLVPDEKIIYHASPVPTHGIPVRLLPRHN
ncbi:PREDICTED: beta-amyrin 28-oxidase-like [Ipomoea nil]|uniref:beta-amyrin 28-oxidase-like n=1 Tax=Ipomoea nil TaxID=35883 RepID=UPI00090147FF|nr:PREDICTED: beta-amyrin 28-oxidase-like [Ipomoea nil]